MDLCLFSKFRILDEVPNEVEEHSQGRSPSPNSSKAEQPDAAPPTTSTTTGGHTTGSVTVFPRLMESIHATKDIGDHTVFGGSDVPPLGVVTEHQAELEKVISRKKYSLYFIFSSCSFPFPPIVIHFSVKSSLFKPKINIYLSSNGFIQPSKQLP